MVFKIIKYCLNGRTDSSAMSRFKGIDAGSRHYILDSSDFGNAAKILGGEIRYPDRIYRYVRDCTTGSEVIEILDRRIIQQVLEAIASRNGSESALVSCSSG